MDVVEEVGLWWPAADPERLRGAAAAWDRAAADLDRALEVGRSGAAQARSSWSGEAADRFTAAWAAHEAALRADAAGARALGTALTRFAEAVEDARRRVTELAVTAGATIVAGVGLAWLTFGTSAAAAGAVSAGLVAAAAAIGVELSATAAAILGAVLVGAVFGAVEAAVVDLAVAQPLRVEAFGRGGYSLDEAAGAAVTGGAFGGVLGGIARGVGGGAVRTVQDDLGALDGRISAALDPASRGALGPLFRPGVHESPGAAFPPEQAHTAQLLGSEGRSVHARTDGAALVRIGAGDRGSVTRLTVPEVSSASAVEAAVLEGSGRLARQGGGDLVVDGRMIALDVDEAGKGLLAAVLRAKAEGLELPSSIRFVFDEGSIFWP
ncbi:WXG100 family type VII secretion target [Actinomycetospora sp. NBRC 106378]|uniref:WXG100-like domain-containing protein n=1 Tax=Actinomycetospora sp. NBRC 106378 TaxID=3032208 RepID=UPI0024A04CD1|nr:WXG100 family type VII secretion target [Actinomycetospora sp. NBRC 106378]GLZ51285.1 hypothetical protein Acsp07_09020 [Actinomycetospora sp. NBRC 106378]